MPAKGVTNDDVAARPQQPRRRPQRLVLIKHVAEAGVEENNVGGTLRCRQIHDVATPSPHLHRVTSGAEGWQVVGSRREKHRIGGPPRRRQIRDIATPCPHLQHSTAMYS